MKNLATPLGLAGFGSHSEADRSRDQFFDWRVVAIALFVFASYFLGAKIGFALTFRPHPVSVLWPPNSILLAALLLTPVRIWWVVMLAAFPAFLGPFLSSFLDSAFVVFNHWGQDSYWEIWRIRFTSNVLAALTLAPLIVTWGADGIGWLAKIGRWRFLEAS